MLLAGLLGIFESTELEHTAWVVFGCNADSVVRTNGKVPHKFNRFNFNLFALFATDDVNISDEFGGQAVFPHEIAKGSWVPKRFSHFFIAPALFATFSARKCT
jgi:hypothetical protein